MAVSDKDKATIKDTIYGDEKSFRGAFLNCIKHDDVQKGLFKSTAKGGIKWLLTFFLVSVGAIAYTIINVTPVIVQHLNQDTATPDQQ